MATKAKEVDWESLYKSLAQAVPALEKKILELEKQLVVMASEKAQWQNDKSSQQLIIQQALNRTNSDTNKYLLENQQLRAENKELKAQIEKA